MSDITLTGIELVIHAAELHGAVSEPDHEVGDLQDALRLAWELFRPEQRMAFMVDPQVRQQVVDQMDGPEAETEYDAKVQALLDGLPPRHARKWANHLAREAGYDVCRSDRTATDRWSWIVRPPDLERLPGDFDSPRAAWAAAVEDFGARKASEPR